MKIALIGSDGQLGRDLQEELAGEDLAPLTQAEIEVKDHESVRQALEPVRPDVVVNTAAFHNVPLCETDPDEALAVNGLGTLHLARLCASLGAALLHVSTDYVFDGEKGSPYTEEDIPAPLNVYGVTKLAGEHFVRAYCGRHWVVRTSGLYGVHPCLAKGGRNFVQTMLKLADERDEIAVVDDERLTPTWTRELAHQIGVLIRSECCGVIHATAAGDCTWYEFAEEIFRLAGREVRVRRTTAAEFGASVQRPSYSVLDNARLRAAGLDRMRPWQEQLRSYLEKIGQLTGGAA
jgi:dTDP-4-dehydrorhamnose reductase